MSCRHVRGLWGRRLAVVCAVIWWCSPLQGLVIELDAAAPAAAPAALQVGDSLWAVGEGWVPSAAVDLRFEGPSGELYGLSRLRVDVDGGFAATPVWLNTGILGCDPGQTADGELEFRTFEEAAMALPGRELRLTLVSADTGGLLAQRALTVVAPTAPVAYLSDAAGCPRRELGPGEDLWLTVHGASVTPVLRLWLVPDPPVWHVGDPVPEDVRGDFGPTGELLVPTGGAPVQHLLWSAEDARRGRYGVLLRFHEGDEPRVDGGDSPLTFWCLPDLPSGTFCGGVLIRDLKNPSGTGPPPAAPT